jgi:radical SAM protein with 4Fe4S-binding SPASM domain
VAGCGRRLDSGATFGNLHQTGLVELLERSEEKRTIAERASRLRAGDCGDCPCFEDCHGGCPDDAWLQTGDVTARFTWCESYRMLHEAVTARIAARRGPAPRPAPPRPFRPQPVELWPAVETSELCDARVTERAEFWLLPSDDGRAYRFDSGLAFPRGSGPVRLRLWMHNRHAKALILWEDLVRRPGTSVVLFEAEGLGASLNVANALGATVTLDVPRILADPRGEEELRCAFDRYVSDPLWKVQIGPWSGILLRAMRGTRADFSTRWGPPPTALHLRDPARAVAGVAGEILRDVADDAGCSLAQWLIRRRPCLACEVRWSCGGCLARGDGEACHPTSLELVRRLHQVAADVREKWESSTSE